MSTDLRPLKTIHMSDLFDGRLERFNIRESQNKDSSDQNRCLTDGYNYLWVYGGDDGTVGCFTRYFPNGNPSFILKHICDEFATRIVSENEPEFYGCESEEELEAMWERMAQEDHVIFTLEPVAWRRQQLPRHSSPRIPRWRSPKTGTYSSPK